MKSICNLLRFSFIISISFLLINCKSVQISKHLEKSIDSSFYKHQFTGLIVYNPRTKDTIFSHNAERYFTPASNTKIFTLYTALQYLPKKIPALKYAVHQDTLIVRGTGDPSFLHPYFKDSTALKFMQKYNAIKLVTDNYSDEKFGPGWAWEDYDTYFSPERSAFPMYGNVVTIYNADSLKTYPEFLVSQTSLTSSKRNRDFNTNRFYYKQNQNDTIEVPLVLKESMLKALWDNLIPNRVTFIPNTTIKTEHTLYNNVKPDSLYKRMMHQSDNFLAEQILALASSTISDTLDTDHIRKEVLQEQLKDLKQQPEWVDGSGLSRYNLFTPLSFVQVLEKLYNELPRKSLFNIFPTGGESGTIKNWYDNKDKPFVYAKTGTLKNNHALSGYLITNSNDILIFSFMNNNHVKSLSKVKENMQTILEFIRENVPTR